jgi:WD40 repeat protein
MTRWYPVTVAGAVVVIGLGVAYWLYGPNLTPSPVDNGQPEAAVQPVPVQPAAVQPAPVLQPPKLQAAERPPAPADVAGNPGGAAVVNAGGRLFPSSSSLVIPNCHAQVIYKQEVPSQRDGQLLYVATEIRPEEEGKLKPEQIVTVPESYLYMVMQKDDKAPADEIQEAMVIRDNKEELVRYRRVHDGDEIGEVCRLERLRPVTRRLRILKEGDEVKEGQLLALVDPALTLDEFDIKKTKYWAATADFAASEKTRDEAKERWDTLQRLFRGAVPGSAPFEEVRGGLLTYDRYRLEAISKKEAIKQADRELSQVLTQTKMHEIRAKITGGTGVVKVIYKQKGDAVKNEEPVLQLWHYDRLRIEGRVEMQHIGLLPKGKTVVVEPSHPSSPRAILSGHLQEVRGVAVSKKRQIVSASEDRTVIVWDRSSGNAEAVLRHPAAVLAVTCSSEGYTDAAGKARNLCLSGASDGVGRIWDLDTLPNTQDPVPVVTMQGKHQGPVTCVAFNPSGKWCVTGGEDKTIRLWNTGTGELVQQLKNDGHVAGVTSLQFLSDEKLVSAGKDKQLILWELDANGVVQNVKRASRSNDVAILGGNPKTKQVLVDKGKELQILQMPEGKLVGSLHNPSNSMNFSTMALFSPDGNLILTAGQSESRLQIWRVPTTDSRAYELRQLIWPGQPATCAAFSPMDSDKPEDLFVVTGTADRQVVVWDLPDKKEVHERLTATVTLVEPSLDTASREVRIWAELDNKDRRLLPGQEATMVVYPGK